jgi:hypothetical protein
LRLLGLALGFYVLEEHSPGQLTGSVDTRLDSREDPAQQGNGPRERRHP